jgi:PAS domain S-box-containing protein
MGEDVRGRQEMEAEIQRLKGRLAKRDESEKDLKRTEDALQESEARYRMLADSTFEGIVIHEDGIILDVNTRVEEMAGYTRDELVGNNFFQLLDPEYHQMVVDMVKKDHQSPYQLVARAKDGSPLELEVMGKLIPYEGRTVRVASVRNISERKRQEEALRQSEERYRLLAENVHDVIWTMDLDLNYTYMSPSVLEQRGFTTKEAMDKNIQEVMTPSSLEKVIRAVDEVLKPILAGEMDPHTNVTLDLEMYRKDNNTILTETSISLMLDVDESPIGILGVTRDITERQAAEEAMDASESRYKLLADNVDDVIFIIGDDLTMKYVSPSFERLSGYEPEELVNMGWQDLFTPDSIEQLMEAIAQDELGILDGAEARERSVTVEGELVKKDRSTVWIEVVISGMADESGEVTQMLGVARDISERKATQKRFMDEKGRAELYLDLFGHDIRNINQGIMSYLELMLMRPGIEATEADYIKSVLEQATRINDLVAKVQRLTQLRAHTIKVEEVDAQELIHAAIDYVMAKYSSREVRIEANTTCSTHTVMGSRLLTDVFTSIIENAVRFNRNEVVEVDISCRLSEDETSIQFIFDDRGPGIADEMKPKVFRRLELPEGGTKGSGLGLTVVWEIIRQLGGRVWVEDRVYGDPVKGSRFVVELPRSERTETPSVNPYIQDPEVSP